MASQIFSLPQSPKEPAIPLAGLLASRHFLGTQGMESQLVQLHMGFSFSYLFDSIWALAARVD